MNDTKAAAVSAAILAHVAAGKTPREALDLVLGAGMFDRLTSDLYDALRLAREGLAENVLRAARKS